MKSSIVPFAAGAMTVLGAWIITANRQKINKVMTEMRESMDEMLQKCKKTMQEESCSCNN